MRGHDGAAPACVPHVDAEDFQPAGLQGAGAGDQRQQAGLAHAVRADQAHHAAGGQVERDLGERRHLAIVQADPLQPDESVSSRTRSGRVGGTPIHGASFTASSGGHSAAGSSRT